MILFIRYFPAALKIDLPTEASEFAAKRGIGGKRRKVADAAASVPIIRAYRITHKALVGKTIDEARAQFGQRRGKPLRIRRGGEILDPDPLLKIQKGDVVSVIARLADHMTARPLLGEEVLDPELLNYKIASHEIVVINPAIAGKSLKDLNATTDYGCFVTGVTRAAIDLPAEETTVLNKGDRLHVTGEEVRLQALAEKIGHIEEKVEETDLLTFAFGICGGVLLGLVLVKIGGVSIGLGSAGGLLLAGILIGFLRSMHPTFGRLPAPARYLLMELGLVLFMASVGLNAGGGIVDALTSVGPTLILCGMVVTLTPVTVGYAFGRYVLDLNPALLLGSLTGAMTSTPSLNIVTRAARSGVPALGYAGTYTFANVLLTFAGTMVMTL